MADTLYYVIPCYNEEEVLPETSKRLKVKMTKLMEEGKSAGRAGSALSTMAPGIKPGPSSRDFMKRTRCFPVSIFPETADIRMHFLRG